MLNNKTKVHHSTITTSGKVSLEPCSRTLALKGLAMFQNQLCQLNKAACRGGGGPTCHDDMGVSPVLLPVEELTHTGPCNLFPDCLDPAETVHSWHHSECQMCPFVICLLCCLIWLPCPVQTARGAVVFFCSLTSLQYTVWFCLTCHRQITGWRFVKRGWKIQIYKLIATWQISTCIDLVNGHFWLI